MLSESRIEELQNEIAQARTELAATTAQLTTTTAQLTTTTAQLTEVTSKLSEVESQRDNLRNAYQRVLEQLRLLERRIFVAKAERVDYRQLEMEFQTVQQELDALALQLGATEGDGADDHADSADDHTDSAEAGKSADPKVELGSRPSGKQPPKGSSKPNGRRNLATADMPEQRIELTDPELEGKAEQIGWEESYKLGRQKPGPVRIVIAVRCWPPACASQVQGPWTGGRLRRQVRL